MIPDALTGLPLGVPLGARAPTPLGCIGDEDPNLLTLPEKYTSDNFVESLELARQKISRPVRETYK